jgi:hypothetical protein
MLGTAAEGGPQAIPYSRRISDMAEGLNGQMGENKTKKHFVIPLHDVSESDMLLGIK